MIVELGHFALILALALALLQSVLPLVGAQRGIPGLMAFARPAAELQFLLVLASFVALTYAFVVSDFSVALVVDHSHSAKPLLYKVTGVWGNHEGSLLLWVLILTLFGGMVARFGGNLPATLQARTLAVQAMISVGFMAFTLLTSNPFVRLPMPPADGTDLNPLLQDPGLAFHPPFLYLGYVGFSIVFSFAVAALIEGRVDAAWARWVRPWTLLAWCGLTLGIGLGSWWAYYELGWGGFWFWDPVENASLLPWLSGTALLHSAIVVEKRNALKSWTILLAILTFSLSLIGTFLVRSGVLTSVHAFATDPERGVFILLLLVVAIGGALTLYAFRAPSLRAEGFFAPVSREGALVLNNLVLCTATATVFIGTLYPLFLDAVGGAKISVGPPYFNATFGPLMAALLLLVPVGPYLAWKRADLAGVAQRLWIAAVAAAAIGAVAWWMRAGGPLLAVFGIALAAWLVFGALAELADRIALFRAPAATVWNRARHLPRAAWGMTVAHAGVGIAVAGIVGLTAWTTEDIRVMRPGDRMQIAGHLLRFDGVERVQGPNYVADAGRFVLESSPRRETLVPEKRIYPVAGMNTTEAAIRTTGVGDLYVVLGDSYPDGGWAVRVYDKPLAPWLWVGTIVMTLGGLISLADRRYRVGAPVRGRRPTSSGPQPGAPIDRGAAATR
ncbi:MAG: heme lyase CcmF/NrfE family subunit [Alphaproteobacteria bacterium]